MDKTIYLKVCSQQGHRFIKFDDDAQIFCICERCGCDLFDPKDLNDPMGESTDTQETS